MSVATTALVIALLGGLGAALRYCVDDVLRRHHALAGTYVVNALGSMLFAWLMAAHEGGPWAVGLCGGFTTLSTVSLQAAEMLLSKRWLAGVAHLVAMFALCAAAAWVGSQLA